MVRMTKEEAEEPIPEGVYKAKLVSVEEKDGQYGAYLQWTFRVEDEDDDDVDERLVSGQTNASLKEGSKTDKWITNLGVEAAVGEDVDLDECVGKRAQVVIKINSSKKGDREFSNVSDVLPLKKKKKKDKNKDEEEEKPKKEKDKKKDDDDDEDEKPKKDKKKEKDKNKDDDDDDFDFDD